MRLSRTDVRGSECPACGALVDEACRGVRQLRNGRPWERTACHQERWQIAEANAEILTIDRDGNVANSSGDVVARVIELTLDISAVRLMGGGGHGPAVKVDPSQSDSGTTRNPRASASSPAIARIWAHYQAAIPGAERQTLEGKRRTIIANALKVRTEAECIAAIDGLACSPFHNGQNERRKKYLGIQYALKGVGAEGNDERIDKMAGLSSSSTEDAIAFVPSGSREMVRARQRLVEDMLLNPGDANKLARAEGSQHYLGKTWGLVALVREVERPGEVPTGATCLGRRYVEWKRLQS